MTDSPESVARTFVRAINRQDVDALAEWMAPEHRFVDSLGNAVEGREKMRAAWAAYFRMVPDYSIAVEETLCDGPLVVMLGEAQGTYCHPIDEDLPMGTPPHASGGKLRPENHWKTPAAFRVFILDGKVAEWRVYADNEPIRSIMRQRSFPLQLRSNAKNSSTFPPRSGYNHAHHEKRSVAVMPCAGGPRGSRRTVDMERRHRDRALPGRAG
ncbi:MAG: nuclear transport factor 2 family protein [Terracidiphilus sp.]|jgi:limonene-1,2-epoxide hydrolase